MKFCANCGKQMDDGVKFCPGCGTPAAEPEKQAEPTVQDTITQKFEQFNNTADNTAEYDQNDISSNKAMAILAYLSWLVLIPLFAAKDSKFARFHTNQGLVLAIAEIAYAIVVAILNAIFIFISFRLAAVMSTIFSIASLAFLVLTILGIVNAANGKAKELPIIGSIKLLK